MKIKFLSLVTAICAIGVLPLLAQDEGASKTTSGTLTLEKKTYPLKQALAYETTIDDNEPAIAVVVSGPAISTEKLEEAREAEKDGRDPDFKRPFLRLLFEKSGKLKYWSAAAGVTMLGRHGSSATGELTHENARVSGHASQATEKKGMFESGFDVHFEAALLQAGDKLPSSASKKYGPAANVKPSVTGRFTGNGKEAKLAYVSARWGEPFDGKPGIVLVFSEKDHAKDKKPDFDASFGRFGSALIISLFEDGQIYSCQVVHSAHQKQGFSSIGNLEATEFTYADGKVEGELTTHGPVDTFGEKWEVALKFVAPLGELLKELQPAEVKKPEKKSAAAASDEDAEDKADVEEAGEQLKAKDLALTKDATEVEYKALVQHIAFKSKADVKSACADLAANLKAQGWTTDGQDLIQATSSILKRKRGPATLTIFVKPENGGSEVKMMTEGLSWE